MVAARAFPMVLCLTGWTASSFAQSFQGIGDLPGGSVDSRAFGVSADGRTVVGQSTSSAGAEACVWRDGVLTGLGDLPGGAVESFAFAASFDGSILIGRARDASAHRAVRWDGPGHVMSTLPQPTGFAGGATAQGISQDGRTISGWVTDGQLTAYGNVAAFRIDDGVLTGLPVPVQGQGSDSGSFGVPSADGAVLVGRVRTAGVAYAGARWNGTSFSLVPRLIGGADYCQIFGTSADGQVWVGQSCSTAAPTYASGEPCRWQGGLPTGLGGIPGQGIIGAAVSCTSDGAVVVGFTTLNDGQVRAFHWDALHGMRALSTVLANDYGISTAGWILQRATMISPDGDAIVGLGLNPAGMPEGWIARLGCGGQVVHCTAKTNSLGCVPQIESSGAPSASATSGFVVRSTQMRNNKTGLLLYGVSGAAATPFQGGLLCFQPPLKRSTGLFSGGSPSGQDCSGVFSLDVNSFARGLLGGTPLPALSLVGTVVDCQFWGRDPGFPAPNNTQLSDALRFTVCH